MNPKLWVALLVLVTAAAAVAGLVFRAARRACRERPALRPLMILAALAALGAVAWSVPRLGALEPPFSESPAGILVVLGRVLMAGLALVVALATIAAVVLTPTRG